MNYNKHYQLLISNAKTRDNIEGYSEKHHIIPSCLGGSDDAKNLVLLTLREHFISTLNQDELKFRMKNSFGNNEEKRAHSIKIAKSSTLRFCDTLEEFNSLDCEKITSFTYSDIKYRIKRHQGILINGRKVEFVKQYKPN